MSDDAEAAVIRWIRPDEVEVYRTFRLRALADAPDAFSDSYAAAIARPEQFWHERVARTAAGIESVLVVAADPATDAWLGMTGCFLDESDATVANVVSVWVAPEVRRRGLARKLMEATSAWAESRGARTVKLWVTATNLSAQRVYQAAGFSPTGVVRRLPSNPRLDEREMARTLRA